MPTFAIAYRLSDKTIYSCLKLLTRKQYLEIMNSDSAIIFPSMRENPEDVYFMTLQNEKGELTSRIAPVVAYVEQR